MAGLFDSNALIDRGNGGGFAVISDALISNLDSVGNQPPLPNFYIGILGQYFMR